MIQKPEGPGAEESGWIDSVLLPAGSLDARSAFLVYKNAYLYRLTDALANVYETTAALLKPSEFRRLCGAYIYDYPSHFYSLSDYGQHFPAFLKGVLPDSVSLPFAIQKATLTDLAEFELAFSRIFHKKASTENAPDLSDPGLTDASLKLRDTAYLFSSQESVYTLWKNRKVLFEEDTQPLYHKSQYGLLYRTPKQNGIFVKEFGRLEYDFVKLLCEGHSIVQAGADLETEKLPERAEERISEIVFFIFDRSLFSLRENPDR